jgi:hypothetical protein
VLGGAPQAHPLNGYEELVFLKSIQRLLLDEIKRRKKQLSGYLLSKVPRYYLEETIKNLEETKKIRKQVFVFGRRFLQISR